MIKTLKYYILDYMEIYMKEKKEEKNDQLCKHN